MILNIVLAENTIPVEVPDFIVTEAVEVFDKIDQDMNQGWQMSREWVNELNTEQRCQVVADKLLTALETENEKMQLMMAAYILNRVPGIKGVRVATNGEIQETELLMHESQF
jgi:DNA-binding transcriptional regulator YbjK